MPSPHSDWASLALRVCSSAHRAAVCRRRAHRRRLLTTSSTSTSWTSASSSRSSPTPRRSTPRRARSARPEAHRRLIAERTAPGRLHRRRTAASLADGHLSAERRQDHHPARPAVLSRPGRRHHPHRRWRGRSPSPPNTGSRSQLRARAAADHRPLRRRQPHQAPPGHLRRDSAEPGAGGPGHRRPPLLRARRRQLLPHGRMRRAAT